MTFALLASLNDKDSSKLDVPLVEPTGAGTTLVAGQLPSLTTPFPATVFKSPNPSALTARPHL
jgi:hypothetical protein